MEGAPGAFALGPLSPGSAPFSVNGERAPARDRRLEESAGSRNTSARELPVAERAVGIREGLRDAGPVALAGFASNAANVVVTVLVARLLATRGYGALAQLTSLFLIVSMPGTAVVVGVVRRVTALAEQGRAGPVRHWARRVHRLAVMAVGGFAVVAFAVKGLLAHDLSIPSSIGVFCILVAGAVWVLLSLDRGLLQADRKYRALSANLVVEGGARTAAVLCLVGAGFGVSGAALGMLIAEVLTAVHARLAADRAWAETSTVPQSHPRVSHHRLFLDVGAALVAMALLAYLQNVDVIILGREAPHHSGPYAAISVASKALVFGAIALGGYLLPEAAIEWHRGGHALRQLGVTLLVLAIPGTALILAAIAFPNWLLSLVFSSRYLGAHSAFWLLALAMAFLSGTVIMTMYLLAAGQRWIGALLLLGAVVATLAVSSSHGAPHSTAAVDLAVQAGLAVATCAAFTMAHTRRSRPGDLARVAT